MGMENADSVRMIRTQTRKELMQGMGEGEITVLENLADSIKDGRSEFLGVDDEGVIRVKMPVKEGEKRWREKEFGGEEAAFLVGALGERGVEIEQ